MCNCNNKKLVDYTYMSGGMHTSTYECLECGNRSLEIDTPVLYDYDSENCIVDGVLMNEKDVEIIKNKEELIEKAKNKNVAIARV